MLDTLYPSVNSFCYYNLSDMSKIAHHFLPSHITQKRARLLRHGALINYIVATLVLLFSIKGVSAAKPGVLGYASNINVKDLIKYTNEERSKAGLEPLKYSPDLSDAALLKAKDMFKYDYWAHVSPSGVEPWYFFGQIGYDYSYAGENLAKNFSDSKGVVRAWMNSPSHRENMLNSNYDELGFAVVNGTLNDVETTLVVQFFGKRREGLVASNPEGSEGSSGESVIPDNPVYVIEENNGFEKKPKEVQEKEYIQVTPRAPLIDLFQLKKVFALILGTFLLTLFAVDFWYSSSKGIVKVNGHTLAHIFILALTVISIGLVMIPGRLG